MNLEKIQDSLISNFDFDKVLNILNKVDENYKKKDLIEISKNLIKMLYQSRDMHDVFFTSGPLLASKSYVDNIEVLYILDFSFNITSEFIYELEKPFDNILDEKNIIKNEIEELLELNQKEYDENNSDLAFKNIQKLEKMMILLN